MLGKTFKINGMCPMCPHVFLGAAGSDAEDRAGRPPAFFLRNRLSDLLFLSSALQLWSVASSASCFLAFALRYVSHDLMNYRGFSCCPG
jgi:hypothetical protein